MGTEVSSPASLHRFERAVEKSPIPLLACSLSDQRIVLVNAAASKLFELPQDSILGRRASKMWKGTSSARSDEALSTLVSGAVDSYRARREISTAGGILKVWLWARTVHLEKESVAVCVVIPETEGSFAGHLIGTYFGPDAIDLAVGSVDTDGRLCEITPRSEVLIGFGREEIEGSDLASLVHPDDVDRLMSTLAQATASADEATVNVRLRHPERGWAEVRCFAFSSGPGQPLRLAFALADDHGSEPDSGRFADLERQVLRIAAELHAVHLTHRDLSSPHESRDAALEGLAPQQRKIVDRLLRGERIATIAESMYLSPSTVRNHLSKVFRLVGVSSQAELLSLLRSEVGADPKPRSRARPESITDMPAG